MPRSQDVLFGVFVVVVLGLLAFHIGVIVVALLGAFACGSFYMFAGMMPSAEESFGQRVFTSVFLSAVVSSLILILPGTLGPRLIHHDIEHAVLAVAALPPLIAVCFEVLRTPRVIRGILRWLGYD